MRLGASSWTRRSSMRPWRRSGPRAACRSGSPPEPGSSPISRAGIALIRAWKTPDYTSVNLSEEGAIAVMETLVGAGIGIEAGISTVVDVKILAASGLDGRLTRILIEPVDASAAEALGIVDDIHRALDRLGLAAPRLQHGDGAATWILLADAVRRGIDTRIGLEDTVAGPNGAQIAGNEDLVRAAYALGAGATGQRGQAGSGAG